MRSCCAKTDVSLSPGGPCSNWSDVGGCSLQGLSGMHTTFAVLARELDFRVADTEMSCESIRTAEGLFLRAQVAAHLLLATIVNSVLVSSQVVGAREDCVARLSRAWVYAFAAVGAGLCIQ